MNRREFFILSAGASLLPIEINATEHIDECQGHATKLAMAMQQKYGGNWRTTIDPDNGFVVVVKEG
ncbi:hypothetical protein GOL85_13440 [Sinorhizobium medicae]|nr:hypothetical protein [Sinorhizobium medicae]